MPERFAGNDTAAWYCKFLKEDGTCYTFDINYDMTKNGTVNFSSSQIAQVNVHSFDGLDRFEFKYLDMFNNSISQIYGEMFTDYTKLKRINLGRNHFKSLPQKLFKTQYELEILSLSYNFMTSLPREAFDNTQLKRIDLSYNNFTSLGAEIFNNLTHIETILLGGNQLESIPMMDNIFSTASMKNLVRFELQDNLIYRLQDKNFNG